MMVTYLRVVPMLSLKEIEDMLFVVLMGKLYNIKHTCRTRLTYVRFYGQECHLWDTYF